MSEPESEHDDNNNNNNNPFSFLFQLLGAFDHSFVVSRLTLSRLSIFFGIVFGGGGLAVIVQDMMSSPVNGIVNRGPDTVPPSEDEMKDYEEIPISIDFACATETMKTKAIKRLNVLPGTDLKITKELSNKKELWPVYRWKCLYELSQENSATIPLGLDLKAYCEEARGVEFSYGYKNYLDPYSFYCTRIDNTVVD